MTKEKTLDAIKYAKEAHKEQMANIKFLIEGKHIDNLTPVSKMKCAFGQWFYKDDQNIKNILGVQFYDNLDSIHEAWHMQYAKIHAIFVSEKEEGFFSKLFKTHKISALELEKAKVYYKELEEITKDLLKVLDASQRRTQALSPSKFS